MPEFRENVEAPPTVLYVSDLEELQEMLIDGLRPHSNRLEVNANHRVTNYKADTLQKLLETNRPKQLNTIEFRVLGWTPANDIDRGITLRLSPFVSDFQIFARDETWFRGKKQQISDFLRSRRPWFARGGWRVVRPLMLASPSALLLATVLLAVTRFWLAAAFTAVAMVGDILGIVAHLNGKLFRRTKIVLTPKERVVTLELVTCVATVGACLLALGSFLFQLSSHGVRSVPPESKNSPPNVFRPLAPSTPSQSTGSPIEPLAGPQAGGFEQFKEHWRKLDGRFREQDEFITECIGKTIDWMVVYDRPSVVGDEVMLSFGSPAKESHETVKFEGPVSAAVFPAREKERILSLKTGDVIELRGTLTRVGSALLVKGSYVQLVSPVSKPAQ